MRTLRDFDPRGRRILVRADYNVPLTPEGGVADTLRIEESLPTVKYLLERGGRVILMSHLGRPKGVTPSLSLKPVRDVLSRLLGRDVAFSGAPVGTTTEEAAASLQDGAVLLLENLRFDRREEANDPEFAGSLARLGEVFVEDAFGSVHRAHASTVGVARRLPTYAGLLIEKEVSELRKLLDSPEKPFVAVLGGAKVEDKLPLIMNLLDRVDGILVGSAMGHTMHVEGASRSSPLFAKIEETLKRARELGVKITLPIDFMLGKAGAPGAVPSEGLLVPGGYLALDIGPRTITLFQEALQGARTVFVNGPLGKAEQPDFAVGTREVFRRIGEIPGTHVLAGGDSASVVKHLGLSRSFTYISTGGGAAIEFLEGRTLPGLEVIPE